ncbi:MAG TPA: hypothetical protein PKD70_15210 [Saprospiraceae bacterium]|nr:hypothetical protein [Saprospiraceae bacterium]HMP15226.1 hypothetical protein [Saprospiraceae bacterium]
MKNTCALLLIIAICSFTLLHAQPPAGSWGVGIQFGSPSGLTLKRYNPSGMAFDALLAWDLDDFFFVNIHGLWEKPAGSLSPLRVYYGPGAFIGFIERRGRFRDEDDVRLGISGTLGLNYYLDRFEIYLQLTPRLQLVDRTDGSVGGGLGLRFYF